MLHSVVTRFVLDPLWDQKVPGSNPGAPTSEVVATHIAFRNGLPTAVHRDYTDHQPMPTTSLRLIVLLALCGQLMPLGLPFACPWARRAASACEQSMTSTPSTASVGSMPANAAPDQAPCVNSVYCAVVPTAILAAHGAPLAPAAGHAAPVAYVAALNPGDPPAPLSPPPQA